MKIVVVEDNHNLAKSIERVLRQNHFSVAHFTDGLEAETYIVGSHDEIDLIILDLQLPGTDGLSMCQTLRQESITTPILMLTAQGEVSDRVKGLQVGADDYVSKPFAFTELLARIDALLRRPPVVTQNTVHLTPTLTFDGVARRVTRNDVEVTLTPKEFEIVAFLVRHKNEAVSQQAIFDHCFDFAKENWSNTIEVHIKNIRKKLFADHETSTIKTIREFGYRLEVE